MLLGKCLGLFLYFFPLHLPLCTMAYCFMTKSFKLNCCFLLICFIFYFHVDISYRKRVKLTDLDVNIPLSCRRNASSTPLEERQSPRCKFLLLTIHCFSFLELHIPWVLGSTSCFPFLEVKMLFLFVLNVYI